MRTVPEWNGALILSIVRKIKRHVSEDRGPSPHKAIVLFLAIQRLAKTSSSLIDYEKDFSIIRALIKSYELQDSTGSDYPFWYLQNDHVFEVFYTPPIRMRKGKEFPPHRSLIDAGAVGKLPFWIEQVFRRDPELREQALRLIARHLIGTDLEVLRENYFRLVLKKRED